MPSSLAGLVAAAAAFRAPDVVGIARDRRRGAMDAELPQLLDLLAAASSAGLAGPLALRRAVEAIAWPLAEELGRVVRRSTSAAAGETSLLRAPSAWRCRDLRRAVARAHPDRDAGLFAWPTP